jgi:hypothetical protein
MMKRNKNKQVNFLFPRLFFRQRHQRKMSFLFKMSLPLTWKDIYASGTPNTFVYLYYAAFRSQSAATVEKFKECARKDHENRIFAILQGFRDEHSSLHTFASHILCDLKPLFEEVKEFMGEDDTLYSRIL